jgi:hypothetical protein
MGAVESVDSPLLPPNRQESLLTETATDIALARLPSLPPIESAFGLPGGSIDQNGLVLGDRTLSFEEWAAMGHGLSRFNRWSRFAVGDWLNWGAEHLDEDMWAQAIEAAPSERYEVGSRITGLKVETLRNYASLCHRVPVGVRRVELGFSDHEPVAALDAEQQVIWLERMVENSWDRAELRQAIKDAFSAAPVEGGDDEVVVLPPISIHQRKEEILDLIYANAQPTEQGGALISAEVWAQVRAVCGDE